MSDKEIGIIQYWFTHGDMTQENVAAACDTTTTTLSRIIALYFKLTKYEKQFVQFYPLNKKPNEETSS